MTATTTTTQTTTRSSSSTTTTQTNPQQPVKLNLGAGSYRAEGWVNVDIVPEFEPDLVEDIAVLPSFGPNSVDSLISSHCIEHLDEPMAALRRWYEILKPGGDICVICPDSAKAVELWQSCEPFPVLTDNPLVGLMAVATGFYGYQDYQAKSRGNPLAALAQTHKRAIDRPVLTAMLELAGFTGLEFISERDHEAAPHFVVPVTWQMCLRGKKPG